MKTVAIHTLGCKVNQVESEQIIEGFLSRGYILVSPEEPADICVINTCTVTHVSDRKSRAVIRRAVRRQPGSLVVVTGCMAQLDQRDLLPEGVGLLVGNRDKDRLAEVVEYYLEGSLPGWDLTLPSNEDKLRPVLYSRMHERTRAFVKIQDGCQSFCSYCIVPYVRGQVRSKMPDDAVQEVQQLVDLGYKEIVLTGIHCGLYGADLPEWDLTRLIRAILEQVEGDYRIRIGSVEPLEIKPELVALMADSQRLCRHLHMPLQSGSDRILTLMKRRYSRDQYLSIAGDVLEQVRDVGLAADVMVGFPSETEEDFMQTFELLSELPLLDLHVFKYSARPGTRAFAMGDSVAPAIKQERSERLLELAAEKHRNFCRHFIGREVEVLAERKSGDDLYLGFSDNYVEVGFQAKEDCRGQMVRVRVNGLTEDHCLGDII